MLLQNYTPFPVMMFFADDGRGGELRVVLLRGTFRISPGGRVRPDPEQRAVVLSDVHHGALGASSVRVESEMAPLKRRSDVLLDATAHAPHGLPARSWLVGLRVGPIEKTLRVTGPRCWERSAAGELELGEPEPCMEVPLRYEHAFGGTWTDALGNRRIFRENPIGVGYFPEGAPAGATALPAPRIESLDDPIGPFGRLHRPQGFGPICRAWQPRLARAGTYDDAWRLDRWPGLPHDFDFSFYNCAHPDLMHPFFLQGDEEVTLTGLHPDGELRFLLPDYRVGLLLRLADGRMRSAPMLLDTLFIDVPGGRVHLLWRAALTDVGPLRAVDVRMDRPEERGHG